MAGSKCTDLSRLTKIDDCRFKGLNPVCGEFFAGSGVLDDIEDSLRTKNHGLGLGLGLKEV